MRVFDRYRRNPRHGPLPIPPFNTAKTSHYVFVWDLRRQVLECLRLEPAADLSDAMAASIDRLASEGWQARSHPPTLSIPNGRQV